MNKNYFIKSIIEGMIEGEGNRETTCESGQHSDEELEKDGGTARKCMCLE